MSNLASLPKNGIGVGQLQKMNPGGFEKNKQVTAVEKFVYLSSTSVNKNSCSLVG